MSLADDFSAAITIGDPAGIGPEIIARFFSTNPVSASGSFVVGRAAVMGRACELVGSRLRVAQFARPDEIQFEPGTLPVLEVASSLADQVQPGEVCAAGGQLAYQALKVATALTLDGQADAVVTAPLNKKALNAAGIDVPGHTELLAKFC